MKKQKTLKTCYLVKGVSESSTRDLPPSTYTEIVKYVRIPLLFGLLHYWTPIGWLHVFHDLASALKFAEQIGMPLHKPENDKSAWITLWSVF